MANDFTFFSPTKIVFGRNTQHQAGQLVSEYHARKVLVHYGGESAIKSGLLEQVTRSLELSGIPYVTLGGVVPNPHVELVYRGIALCKEENIDFILAVGGGSVIDSAKAIGYGLCYDGDVWDLFEKKGKASACVPIGVILTIAASGSETSSSCVITHAEKGLKRSYNDNLARPRFAIMNPELTMRLPPYQTASGCTDIMMHTMERYFTNGAHMEITDTIAEGLLRNVIRCATILHENPRDYDARSEIMWCGSLAHNDLTGCGGPPPDSVTHLLEHELGGMFDVTHGAGLAAVWPSWARYVYRDCPERFARFARNVMQVTPGETDMETAEKGIRAMEDFYHSIGMPTNLRELGICPTDSQIRILSESCASACGGSRGSAKLLFQEDMEKIYHLARG